MLINKWTRTWVKLQSYILGMLSSPRLAVEETVVTNKNKNKNKTNKNKQKQTKTNKQANKNIDKKRRRPSPFPFCILLLLMLNSSDHTIYFDSSWIKDRSQMRTLCRWSHVSQNWHKGRTDYMHGWKQKE